MASGAEIFKLWGTLNLDDEQALKQFNITKRELNALKKQMDQVEKSFVSKWNSIGAGMQRVGGVMQKVGATILTATAGIAAGSIKLFSDYETGVAKVSTLAGDSASAIGKSLMDMSSKYGVPAVNLLEDSYNALSASVPQEEITNFTEDMIKLSKSGFTDTGTAIDLCTTIINSYGMSLDETESIMDTLINTQNRGKTTIGELGSSMGKIIPTAKSLGVDLKNISSGYALMTSKGVATAETTTYMNSMLNELGKSGTTAFKEFKKATGKTFPDFIKAGGSLGDALGKMDEHAKKNKKSLSDMFGSAEAGKAALLLATGGGSEFNEILKSMDSSAGATDDAFAKVSNTLKERLNRGIESTKNGIIRLGEKMMPVIESVIAGFEKFTTWVSSLSDETIESAAQWLKWGAIIGGATLALGTVTRTIGGALIGINSMTSGLGGLIARFTGIQTSAPLVNTAIKTLGTTATATVGSGSVGIGGLITGLGSLLPVIGGVAAVVSVGALAWWGYKEATEPCIQSTNELIEGNKELSQSTKDAMLSMTSDFDEIQNKYFEMETNKVVITNETSAKIEEGYNKLTGSIKNNLEEQKNAEIAAIEYLKETNPTLYQEYLEAINVEYDTHKSNVDTNQKAITDIFNRASQENRAITQEEWAEINRLTSELQRQGLESIAISENEKLAVMKMSSELTLAEKQQWATNMLSKADEVFQAEVQRANDTYANAVLAAQNQTNLSEEQKNEAIRIAEEKMNKEIGIARNNKQAVVENVKNQWAEVGDYINTGTGETLGKLESWFLVQKRKFEENQEQSRKTAQEFQDATHEMASDAGYSADQLETGFARMGESSELWSNKTESNVENAKKIFQDYVREIEGIPTEAETILSHNFDESKRDALNLQRELDNIPSIIKTTHQIFEKKGGFARGTASVSQGGIYNVGEYGPEFIKYPSGKSFIAGLQGTEKVALPKGSSVKTARETKEKLGNNDNTVVVKLDIDGKTFIEAVAKYLPNGLHTSQRRVGFGNT